MNKNLSAVKTYTELSSILRAIREDTISEVDAILELQIGSEGQLSTLQAIRGLPTHVSLLPLSKLTHIAKVLDSLGAEDVKDAKPAATDEESDSSNPEEDSNDDPARRVWVIVRTINANTILTGVRGEGTNNAGTLAFPGGHPEKGEDSAKGAARELYEETGIKCKAKDLEQIGGLMHKGVCHEFFQLRVANAAEARSIGLTNTDELHSFRFWRTADLAAGRERKTVHKSIKRFLDMKNI